MPSLGEELVTDKGGVSILVTEGVSVLADTSNGDPLIGGVDGNCCLPNFPRANRIAASPLLNPVGAENGDDGGFWVDDGLRGDFNKVREVTLGDEGGVVNDGILGGDRSLATSVADSNFIRLDVCSLLPSYFLFETRKYFLIVFSDIYYIYIYGIRRSTLGKRKTNCEHTTATTEWHIFKHNCAPWNSFFSTKVIMTST